MRKKIDKVLIIGGAALFIIFRIITWIGNIPTVRNFAAFIGLSLLIPTCIGLFLYSEKIKSYRFALSICLKGFSIIYIIAYIISSAIFFSNEY